MRALTHPRGSLLGPVVLIAVAVALMSAATAARANPPKTGWRVGQPMDVPVQVSAAALDAAKGKAFGLLTAAGVHAATFETTRAHNQFEEATQDTTVALDAQGRALATLTQDVDRGSIRSLVRFDSLGASRGGDPAAAPAEAASILSSVGIDVPTATAEVAWDDGMGAWMVSWRRFVDVVPVPADGLTVWVTPQGQLRAIGNQNTEVSRGPRSLDEATARRRVKAFLNGNAIARQAKLGTAVLEWRQPNDFVEPSLPDSPAPTIRLVYAVSYVIDLASGQHSEGVLWVDAESGDLVGGSDVG
jgi:hypothetical protein